MCTRYPFDPHDRLWTAATAKDTTNPSQFEPRNTSFIDYGSTDFNWDWPAEVERTAWEGLNLSSNISVKLNIGAARSLRPIPTFYVCIGAYDVNPGTEKDVRIENIYLEDEGARTMWTPGPVQVGFVLGEDVWNTKQLFSSDSPVFWVTPDPTSTRPAMINALEILGEFEAQTRRTAQVDALTVKNFSSSFQNNLHFVDTVGDPCLPVPWNWLICSIEIPPRVTQTNLTSAGIMGTIPVDFGSLDRLTVLDLSNNSFSGSLPQSLVKGKTLRELNLADNYLAGNLSLFAENPDSSALANLEILSLRNNSFSGDLLAVFKAFGPRSPVSRIDLSHNSFSGSIPEDVRQLTSLEALNLSHDYLTGPLPTGLFTLPGLATLSAVNNSLTELNLSAWSKVVSNSSFDTYQQKVSLIGNRVQNVIIPPAELIIINRWSRPGRSVSTPSPRDTRRNEAAEKALIISLVISGLSVLLMACILVAFLGRMLRRTKQLRRIQTALAKEDVRPPIFDYDELKAATKDFSQHNELGKGAFGAVYNAELPDKKFVAVKLLITAEQDPDISDFLQEMVIITGIKHRHLLQLKGCCVRDRKRILVYEYAENRSLAQALWGNQKSCVLTWEQRDIKAQNILLDKAWNAKIADFGLARTVNEVSSQRVTTVGGTLGYIAPEYATQGLLTEKLDVYSYGILLLEIVCGRRCISTSAPKHEVYLRDWAFTMYKEGRLAQIAETCISETVPAKEIESVLQTALSCLQVEHERRPSMSDVVKMLSNCASDVAADIVGELKDQQVVQHSPQRTPPMTTYGEKIREHVQRSLLKSASCSSDQYQNIKPSVSNAR
ncbi:hypothetical protein R1flu_003330 [Riccia fluitans]|uniref:non-specific serine/threonine protein kinase n=1 Tax=Riccia fluitans TaxID=41844 RepID=A0ABD1Y8V2_9MARC